jgi:hypothetical protein
VLEPDLNREPGMAVASLVDDYDEGCEVVDTPTEDHPFVTSHALKHLGLPRRRLRRMKSTRPSGSSSSRGTCTSSPRSSVGTQHGRRHVPACEGGASVHHAPPGKEAPFVTSQEAVPRGDWSWQHAEMATTDKAIVCLTLLGVLGLVLALSLWAFGVALLAACVGAFSWAAVCFSQAARMLRQRQRRLPIG